VAVSGQAILGSGDDLRVLLVTRGGGQVITEINPDSGSFNRRLDTTTAAALTATVSGDDLRSCCDEFTEAYAWATELLIIRDGRDQWAGPVTNLVFGYGTVEVEASDLTAWWDRRVLPNECHLDQDLSDIFLDYHNDAMAPDPSPNIVISATRTGITGRRQVLAEDYDYASDHILELTRTGLDFTAFGRTVIVGGEEVPTDPIVTLTDEDWITPPTVQERGNEQATEVVVRGNSERGKFRATASDQDYIDFYGLVVRVFNEGEIRDQTSLQVAADTRLDLLKDPLFIVPPQNAGLRTTAPITLSELVPGARVRVDTSATCRKLVRDFRLEEVKVDFNGTVSISLQPIGTTQAGGPGSGGAAVASGSNCTDLPIEDPDQT
jgi:hypothetical protein